MVNSSENGRSGRDNGRKVTALRDLPHAIEPTRDLWAGIESQIKAAHGADAGTDASGAAETVETSRDASNAAPPRGSRRLSSPGQLRWLAAAAVVAALAVGMWIGRSLLPVGGPAPSTTHVKAGDPAELVQAMFVTDPKYRRQREALVKSLEAQLNSLPPDSRAKVIASLATIHKSMRELEAALGHDPSNALLQELLVNTYQDEMRVLTTVHEADTTGRGI